MLRLRNNSLSSNELGELGAWQLSHWLAHSTTILTLRYLISLLKSLKHLLNSLIILLLRLGGNNIQDFGVKYIAQSAYNSQSLLTLS